MEKHTPHCKLSTVKSLLELGKVRATQSALTGGVALGLDFVEMLEVINGLKPSDFYKSMTTHANNRIWQDVYRPVTQVGEVYLKLTVIDDVLIVSFKEL
jgi:motility quorum-sensing regulator/GCU-specific mRNA interferase toxin